MDDADFDKIMLGNKSKGPKGQKRNVIDTVKDKVRQRTQQKNKFKTGKGKKRPGKVARGRKGRR